MSTSIYRGRVGAKLKPFTLRGWSRRVPRVSIGCTGGPFPHDSLNLAACGDGSTLVFRVGQAIGRYVRGTWSAA